MVVSAPDKIDAIVDQIYEAAVLPELWPGVLDVIASLSKTQGGILFAVPPQTRGPNGTFIGQPPRWTSSRSLADAFAAFIRDGWLTRNTRAERSFRLNHAGFVVDQDIFTPDDLENEPLCQWFRQMDLGWSVGTGLVAPTGDALIFSWERRFADGPISRETVALIDPLRGHLARASLISSRLGLERARTAAETLGTLGLPAAVLSAHHRIIAANARMEALMPNVVEERATGRIHLADGDADPLFSRALVNASLAQSTDLSKSTALVFSVPVAATVEHPPMVVHVIPVRRAARDIFATAASIAIVTPVCQNDVPSAAVIQGLFDLTAAEARVARLIAKGDTVRDIATSLGTQEGTIRNQLKAVFSKTGVSRQASLVSLLGSANPLR